MLDFIYDSLDTVKKLKFPTSKQIVQLTIGIFVLVFVAGVYFIVVDTLFKEGYKSVYSLVTGTEIATTSTTGLTQEQLEAMLSGAAASQNVDVEAATSGQLQALSSLTGDLVETLVAEELTAESNQAE